MSKQNAAKIEAALSAVAESAKAEKAPSGMSLAIAIFNRIHAEGYELPEGKKHRGHFIDLAMTEIGLKKNAAATYYSNIDRKLNKGGPLYQTASKKQEVVAEQIASTANAGDIFRPLATSNVNDEVDGERVDVPQEEGAETAE